MSLAFLYARYTEKPRLPARPLITVPTPSFDGLSPADQQAPTSLPAARCSPAGLASALLCKATPLGQSATRAH